MIEVKYRKGGWYWTFISEDGRVIYTSREQFISDFEANAAAKKARQRFHTNSRFVDEL